MPVRPVKTAPGLAPDSAADIRDTVQIMLARLRAEGAPAALDYAARLDRWTAPVVVPPEAVARAAATVPEDLKAALDYAHDNIRAFATAQRASLQDMEVELRPGLLAGQRCLPVQAAGCYVPGGRYAHIASALMTIATARAAGVDHVTACAPPRDAGGIHPATLYAMQLAGADTILCLGGVQGVAAMAFGLFHTPPADVLAGPGNAYVAEAKRQLFGPLGIDMFAGPTDVLILADASADPELVSLDLVGQAEHGANSPCWLVTDHAPLAEAVARRVPELAATLPAENAAAARAAWDALGEILLCDTRDEMRATADRYAPEHLQVMCRDLDWWRDSLCNYGSLFLGPQTTVAFGDKASGPNHVLPTSGAARYTGGLSVHKFLKTVTWQRASDAALPELAQASAVISRAEGMVGHALTAEARLFQATPRARAANDRS
ncbi:histidinol dehydrogenase [Pseudoponticoccus marisrubri]|uniref:Histidinol dehydrogenase homolog n=1 Tax=Pseudoponticoccus marisrubri TaxID=1685382 RepID=A0A0W7WNJ2_9RHOB|nr:histidinol dehydrogenase [Pseudoponticoccus marisrubri]KUF12179.1 histidinol dehydrogenase [Pseudoponticoccus marisrubri]